MKIADIISCLESAAPPPYQESYDNAGLITGNADSFCTGVLLALDATAAIVEEAIARNCNLVVAHHPILFRGIKKLNGNNYVEQTLILAIKNDIAIYACHTNLDNMIHGVNGRIADKLGLIHRRILEPKPATLKKLFTFVPPEQAEQVRMAIFREGAGQIGNYTEASFNAEGTGTYKPGDDANPFKGQRGIRHAEKEIKMEFIFPFWLQERLIGALLNVHPYEEPAYDIVELANSYKEVGSGLIGELPEEMGEIDLLNRVKTAFNLKLIRHTALTGNRVRKVAVCGGAGSFLISKALSQGAQFFLTSDIKYHEFFDANGKGVIADIGHYESEQFTIELLYEILREKFPTFAVLKPETITNPVNYYI